MRRSTFALCMTALACGIVLAPLRADAQAPHVDLAVSGCAAELAAAVETALDVELSTASPELRASVGDGSLLCALVCDASGATAVVVHGGDRIEQRIDGDGPGLARRVAIAFAELIEASGVAQAPASLPDAVLPPPLATTEQVEAMALRLRLGGGAWVGGAPILPMGAIELGLEISFTSNVALVLGAAGAIGALDVTDGRLDVRLVSAAVSLRLGGALGPLWLGGGPALRGGPVLWTGTATDTSRTAGRDLTGGWLGIGAVLAAFLELGDSPLRVGVEVEGGGMAFESGALVRDVLAARIGGGWLELRAAIDLTFD